MESDAGKPIKRRKRKEFGPADYSRLHSLRLGSIFYGTILCYIDKTNFLNIGLFQMLYLLMVHQFQITPVHINSLILHAHMHICILCTFLVK